MPQAAEQTRWTYEDAIHWIAGNFRWPGGFIRARAGYAPTDLDLSAIQFLVDTQGYAWEGK